MHTYIDINMHTFKAIRAGYQKLFDAGLARVDCRFVRDGNGSLGDGYIYLITYLQYFDENDVNLVNTM